MSAPETTTKTFGSGQRNIPVASAKASKWYPAEDTPIPKKVCLESRLDDLRGGSSIRVLVEFLNMG